MSDDGALVAELKRLVLENEQLKHVIVMMDAERELHPMPTVNSRLELKPVVVEFALSRFDAMNSDALAQLTKRGCEMLALEIMSSAGRWGGFVQSAKLAADSLSFRLGAYIGIAVTK